MVELSESSQSPTTSQRSRSEKELQLEVKRTRGEISCAECRRQKLKCDKKIPCSSCVRRGCQSVCPTGTLPPAKPVASEKHEGKLHKKLLQMSKRIRQLEDALKILQARVSSASHPLLTKDLLEIKTVPSSDDVEEPPGATDADIYGDFGTLTIADKGITHFIGRSGADVMLSVAFDESTQEVKKRAYANLPPEIAHLTGSFPFSPTYIPKDQIMATLRAHLPSYDRATALVETYLQHTSLFFRPVKREQIMEELIPKFYKRRSGPAGTAAAAQDGGSEIEEHQLALLLAVFACGAAGDLTLKACNEEGETYRQLARSALSLHSVFEGTSLATVQAVALIGAYDFHSASAQTIESAFKLLSLSLSLGISIGLHWDPLSWNVELKFVQRRRSLFWELYGMDICKSLASGRPMMLHLDEIDCKFPEDEDTKVNDDGTVSQGFWTWKIDYATKIANTVVKKMCTAQPMKYADILELDRLVRAHPVITTPPSALSIPYSANSLQQLIKLVHSEAVLFFIHRIFFIMALRENPKDPLRSRFASSFLATYSSAVSILRAVQTEYDCSNYLLLRQWTLWVLALGCGVAIGSIAATNTLSELSQTALKELDMVIDLFEKAMTHPVAKNGLPILWRLRDKAKSNIALAGSHGAGSAPTSFIQVKTEEVDEALSWIGGTSRMVREGRRPFDPINTDTSTPPLSDSPSYSAPGNPTPSNPLGQNVHNNSAANGMMFTKIAHDNRMEYAQYSGLGWGPQVSLNGYSMPDDQAPAVVPVPNGTNSFVTGGITPADFKDPSIFAMNVDADNFQFTNLGGAMPHPASGSSFFSSMDAQQLHSRTSDVDAMIEDVWRTMLEDPRLTNTGMNEPTFQF